LSQHTKSTQVNHSLVATFDSEHGKADLFWDNSRRMFKLIIAMKYVAEYAVDDDKKCHRHIIGKAPPFNLDDLNKDVITAIKNFQTDRAV
jgi:hypothetical protein